MLVSCSGGSGGSLYEPDETPGALAKKKQTEIMECFINKDKEGLKALFSEYILSSDHNINSKIEQAFDFIDGEIVSYDEPFGDAVGSYEKKSYGGDTSNIITDKGTEYRIDFIGWLSYDEDKSRIGIEGIRVLNVTERSKYPFDVKEQDSPGCRVKIGNFE